MKLNLFFYDLLPLGIVHPFSMVSDQGALHNSLTGKLHSSLKTQLHHAGSGGSDMGAFKISMIKIPLCTQLHSKLYDLYLHQQIPNRIKLKITLIQKIKRIFGL